MSMAEQMQSFAQRVAATHVEWFPTSVRLGTAEPPVIVDAAMSSARQSRTLTEGGFELSHDALLRLPVAYGFTPTLGLAVTRLKDARQFRVDEIRSPGSGEEWFCGLKQI